MQKQTILIVVGTDCLDSDLGPVLERARDISAHLAFLVVGGSPYLPISTYGAMPYGPIVIPSDWQEDFAAGAAILKQKNEGIEALLEKHGVSGDISMIYNEPTSIDEAVGYRARVCDFACVSNDLRRNKSVFDHVLRGVLFASPLGVLINGMTSTEPLNPRHVLIAWNTSLPSARAVHAALPLLLNADQITIASFDPIMTESRDGGDPGSDLAKWLSHHGCAVTVQQYPGGGNEIGDCILERAAELGADMAVMGAYGHARMRQAVFGGTTRTLTEQTSLPVFLAH